MGFGDLLKIFRGGAAPQQGGVVAQAPNEQLFNQLRNSEFAQQLLSPYGLSMPDHLDQNMYLPEPGSNNWFGRHPRVSQGIENALLAAALTQNGDTIGENISNVARAALGIRPARQQYMMQQMQSPLLMAGQLGKLQEQQDKHVVDQAHAEYYRGRANIEKSDAKFPWRDVKLDKNGNPLGINIHTGAYERIPVPAEGMFQAPGTSTGFEEDYYTAMYPKPTSGDPAEMEAWGQKIYKAKLEMARLMALGRIPPGNVPENANMKFTAQEKLAQDDLKALGDSYYTMEGLQFPTEEAWKAAKQRIQEKRATFPEAFMRNPNLTWQDHLHSDTAPAPPPPPTASPIAPSNPYSKPKASSSNPYRKSRKK